VKQILRCVACEAALTVPLTIVSGKTPGVEQPEHKDGEPLTAAGIAFKSWEAIEHSFGNLPALLEFVPQFWLNPDDLTAVVRNTRDGRRLSGCCGLAGCDGPNQLCRCGAEIGTLRTDCWTPCVFIPAPEATEWNEEN
jgi:hypothetical protein